MTNPEPIRHVVLDIEGTTCPVNFVSEVLFPYASRKLLTFLISHQAEEPIQKLLHEVEEVLQQDPAPFAVALRTGATSTDQQGAHGVQTLCSYLDWLIRTDRKITPLKDLQGRIWEEGYQEGELIAPLFDDVPKALQRWHARGLQLSVYSSGSVQAQKLLYAHTKSGDLSHCFNHWFDTRLGPKNDAASYMTIARRLHAKPENVLFISDAIAELSAASRAGMAVMFSLRPGNPAQDSQHFQTLTDFDELDP